MYAYRAWGFYAGVNGQGVINEPVFRRRAPPAHLANIQALLAPETPYGPEIKNAAVFTPFAGSLLTASQYFAGGSSPISLSARRVSSCSRPTAIPPPILLGNMYPLYQQQNTYQTPATE